MLDMAVNLVLGWCY